jgi:hypothetical protein
MAIAKMRYSGTLDQIVDYGEGLIVLALLFGAAAAAVTTGLAAVLDAKSRIVRAMFIALGSLLGFASAWLVLYAHGADSYYGSDYTSRWEHADRFMGTTPIVIAVIGGIATAVCLFAAASSPTRRVIRLLAGPAAVLACFMLLFGWFALTAGH